MGFSVGTVTDLADIVFDLTTGHQDSPNNDFHDTGKPRDPSQPALFGWWVPAVQMMMISS